MPYLIDGHNLIAAMPGIELDELGDERALLERLEAFARRETRMIDIYFDAGRIGGRNDFHLGRIHVHFVVAPRTADDAILSQLRSIGSEAPNWVIVSSDREICDQAERLGARTRSSADFSRELLDQGGRGQTAEKPVQPLSEDEIEEWQALFRRGAEEI